MEKLVEVLQVVLLLLAIGESFFVVMYSSSKNFNVIILSKVILTLIISIIVVGVILFVLDIVTGYSGYPIIEWISLILVFASLAIIWKPRMFIINNRRNK